MESKDIAIIGLSGRMPGCIDINHFWESILGGKILTAAFNPKDLEEKYLKALWENDNYIKTTHNIDDIDKFDADFFGFSPREAQLTDPQFRLGMEVAWEALENSGYNADKYNGTIGVFLASNMSDYLLKHLYKLIHDEMLSENEFPSVYQTCMDYLSTNISYRLNLRGPSLTIQNWCTSGLSSIHVACKSLFVNDCDMALAGGVHVKLPQQGYFSQGSVSDSADGTCRSFDEKASGTIPANGLCIFVLKKLDQAIRENDNIYAVIKGSAINNDGSGYNKLSYHSPSIKGQDDVIKKALEVADVEPETISFIEAHGGATEFGDRSELNALAKHYGKNSSKKTFLGSVKPNIGHMGNISGIPGFLKTVLALQNKKIPPTINFTRMAPRNERVSRNLSINTIPVNWERSNGSPLRACVHNYAVGGSNAHFILEEPPLNKATIPHNLHYVLLVLSAKNRNTLDVIKNNIITFYSENNQNDIADIAYTLNTGRKDFDFRYACILNTLPGISSLPERNVFESSGFSNENDLKDILLYIGDNNPECQSICGLLIDRFSLFKVNFEKTIAEIKSISDIPVIYPANKTCCDEGKPGSISNDLFYIAHQVSLIRLLESMGVEYLSVAASGVGEFIALYTSGILSFENMIRLFLKVKQSVTEKSNADAALDIFNIPDENNGKYFSLTKKAYSRIEDIRTPGYWADVLTDKTESFEEQTTFNDFNVLDLSNLRFCPYNDLLTQKEQTDSSFAFDILIGQLWLNGVKIDWNTYFDNKVLKKIPLPTYPFERKRYWISSPVMESASSDDKATFTNGLTLDNIQNNVMLLWKKIIGLEEANLDDNFFDVGGNSFIGVTLLNKLCSIYKQLDISLKDLYAYPDIKTLSSYIFHSLNDKSRSESSDMELVITREKISEEGFLDKYLRKVISKLSAERIDPENLQLEGIVKDLCFYLKKDLNLVVFTHEIEQISNINDLKVFLTDTIICNKSSKGTHTGMTVNNFNWLPANITMPPEKAQRKNKRAIFVLSTPRSGSTLLRIMLNSHSKLFAPPELGLLIYDSLSEWDKKYYVSEVSKDGLVYAFMTILQIPFAEAKEHVMSLISQKLSIQEIYAVLQDKIGNNILVDKTPYYGYKEEIMQKAEYLFDNPFYIFLHKHPYSMIESFVRNRFDKLVDHAETNPYEMAENEWSEINRNIINFLGKIDPGRFIRISFEELVANPHKTMEAILQKAKIEFEEGVLHPYDNGSMLVGPGDFNLLSHDNIDNSLGEKWKTIRLPITLKDTTIKLANELNYILHN